MVGKDVLQLVVEHGRHRSPHVAASVGKFGNLYGFRLAVINAGPVKLVRNGACSQHASAEYER